MKELFVGGNSWLSRRKNIRDQDGALVPDATAGILLITTDEDSAVPIHATLTQNVVVTGGVVSTVFPAAAIDAHILPLLEQAEAEHRDLVVYDRLVLAGVGYGDNDELVVRRGRKPE